MLYILVAIVTIDFHHNIFFALIKILKHSNISTLVLM
jgi:hypothetical protein